MKCCSEKVKFLIKVSDLMALKKLSAAALLMAAVLMLSSCGKYSKGDKLLSEAVSQYKEQDYQTALTTLQQAETEGLKSEKEESLYFYLGETYYKLGDYEKSLEAHLQVVEIKPDTFKSWVTIGVCYRKLGEDNKALDAYNKALSYDPQNSDSVGLYVSLGALYIENNKPYTAIDYLEKAEEFYPEHPGVHANLAIAYAMAYEYDKSSEELKLASAYGYPNVDTITQKINEVKKLQGK